MRGAKSLRTLPTCNRKGGDAVWARDSSRAARPPCFGGPDRQRRVCAATAALQSTGMTSGSSASQRAQPLPLGPSHCSSRCARDALGDHRAACATSGVLASRALPLERAIARVCQEAGARVARNVTLVKMNLHVLRRIEVAATRTSCPARFPAMQPAANEGRHTRTLTPLPPRCVGRIEVGGRWAPEAPVFLRRRAASAQPALRPAAQSACVQRWSGIIAVAAQRKKKARWPRCYSGCPARPMTVLPNLTRLCTSSSQMPDGKRGPAASRMPRRA